MCLSGVSKESLSALPQAWHFGPKCGILKVLDKNLTLLLACQEAAPSLLLTANSRDLLLTPLSSEGDVRAYVHACVCPLTPRCIPLDSVLSVSRGPKQGVCCNPQVWGHSGSVVVVRMLGFLFPSAVLVPLGDSLETTVFLH